MMKYAGLIRDYARSNYRGMFREAGEAFSGKGIIDRRLQTIDGPARFDLYDLEADPGEHQDGSAAHPCEWGRTICVRRLTCRARGGCRV